MRPDVGRGCAGRLSRTARTRDKRTSATARRLRSRRRSSGRTTAPVRRPDVRSRWRRSSEHRRAPCARLRRALPRRLHALRHAPVPALGGSVPSWEVIGQAHSPERRAQELASREDALIASQTRLNVASSALASRDEALKSKEAAHARREDDLARRIAELDRRVESYRAALAG